jgi:hypothetical protein
VASTTTDSTGYYLFTDLAAGDYIIEVAAVNFEAGGTLAGWSATPQDQGTDDTLDSDGDAITHRSGTVMLAAGEQNSIVDLGYYLPGLNQKGNNGVGNGLDPQPPGNPPINDGTGTAPGDPGNAGGVASGQEAATVGDPVALGGSRPILVFDAATGELRAPENPAPLANVVSFEIVLPAAEVPAPQPEAGSGAPTAMGATAGTIDWTGCYDASAAHSGSSDSSNGNGNGKAVGPTEATGNGNRSTDQAVGPAAPAPPIVVAAVPPAAPIVPTMTAGPAKPQKK